jgi:hypothetical protein
MTTLLLSPEQLTDSVDVPWMREATPAEAEAFRDQYPQLNSEDRDGRPYFPVVIDTEHAEFPANLRHQVTHSLRIFRFIAV